MGPHRWCTHSPSRTARQTYLIRANLSRELGVTTSPALPPQPPPPPAEYELRIEPLFKVRQWWWPKPTFPIQNALFTFGLRLTNQGERAFPGCALRGLHLKETRLGGVLINVCEEYTIQALRPRQTIDIWMGNLTVRAEGEVWLECDLQPTTPNTIVRTLARDPSTGDTVRSPSPNTWSDAWFIQRQIDVQQARTNSLILFLTLLLVLDSLFGLKDVRISLFHLLSDVFLKIGHLFGG